MTEALLEYFAARDKIDEAYEAVAARRAADLSCARGCHQCCVDGLSVLSVEAAAIEQHLATAGLSAAPAPSAAGCAFLDADGACTVYEARPVVCRTHGIPLRMLDDAPATGTVGRPLRVLQGVEVCELNFTEREWADADVLDVERISALLLVVEQRYRARTGASGALERVPLRDVLSGRSVALD